MAVIMRYFLALVVLLAAVQRIQAEESDYLRAIQSEAVEAKKADFGHWGWTPDQYLQWGTHSNRLIPVYTFGTQGAGKGIDLTEFTGPNSTYRSAESITELYGRLPQSTLNPNAEYCDQTDIARIQSAALTAGKKHIFLVVFDGMDWITTRAASIYKEGAVSYDAGRGTGLHFQDYTANGTTQFGFMVTSPYVDEAQVNVDQQTAVSDLNSALGGYWFERGGDAPWIAPSDPTYLIGKKTEAGPRQAYTDSASSATSMTAGIKTFNAAINVDHSGERVRTIAHTAQELGYRIGVVTSVPISHATPAATYAHNVSRNDYQDLTNDLLGLPSVSHPKNPLEGVDVLIGAGYGVSRDLDSGQGQNFVPGNAYLAEGSIEKIDVTKGGRYVVSTRQEGKDGAAQLQNAAKHAAAEGHRLFGFYGAEAAHLPYRTADGQYNPTQGRKKTAESYSTADLEENATLAEMTQSALTVLEADGKPFWMLVEAGDVDWANHDNNIDNSIGAVISGDEAVQVITQWVEDNSSWDETVMIVTADHGHFLVLERPELLLPPASGTTSR
ncbi:Alkaline phosphatase 3 precursor [Thalassoglobus neptunius]|uniref:Alkaline phosphatase 3 n=1 Tax=Thalassoglobus neptunius TaxID=1938619 RepID=A0A5C5X034_9PLAN|nr:alkaline phosphatase [Thalassoglobus neptunius]TWT55552.1 Alkaline phosphatase 3 precursor [Thalassoglobus neptunius]